MSESHALNSFPVTGATAAALILETKQKVSLGYIYYTKTIFLLSFEVKLRN